MAPRARSQDLHEMLAQMSREDLITFVGPERTPKLRQRGRDYLALLKVLERAELAREENGHQ